MPATLAENLNWPPVESVADSHRIVPVRDIDDIIGNGHAMRRVDVSISPGVEEVPVTVEYQNWRVLPLQDVNSVLGVGSDGADYSKSFTIGQLGPVLNEFVGMLSVPCSDCHDHSFLSREPF